MRSFMSRSFGAPDVFELCEIETPQPQQGQIRIRIAATALGFVDGLLIRGLYQIKPPLPYVPGCEIAGTVDAVGPDVAGIRVGDIAQTWQLGGGLAQFIVVDARDVDVIAATTSPQIAAAMLVDFQTAYYALFEQGRTTASDVVLVMGAGAVAQAAVQLAVLAGAEVIVATANAERGKAALALGAKAVIDYSNPNWRDALRKTTAGGIVDVVLDPVGGEILVPAFRSLAKGGRYLVVGFASGAISSVPVNLALLKSASLIGVDIRHFLATQPDRARRIRQSLLASLARGHLRAPAITTFPLDRAKDALDETMRRDKRGKVVVLPE